jgi:hypothetical protein
LIVLFLRSGSAKKQAETKEIAKFSIPLNNAHLKKISRVDLNQFFNPPLNPCASWFSSLPNRL